MKFRKAKQTPLEIDMTPMIDMTFQLIAFFLIVSNFEKTQADERVKLPLDQLAKPPETAREHEIVVNVGFLRNRDGDLLDPEPWVFWTPQTSERVLNTLPLFQQEHRLRVTRDGEEIVGETYVVIRADGEMPTGLVQELIKIAQEAGFHKFVLTASQKEFTQSNLHDQFQW